MPDDVRVRLSAEGEAQVVGALRRVVSESGKMGRESAKGVGQLNTALDGTKQLLGAIAAAVSVGSLLELGKAGAAAADGIGKAAQRAGASVKNMSALSFAAKTADVDFENLQKGMARFAKNVAALEGGDKTQAKTFGALGLKADDFAGKDAAERFALVAQALSKLKDSQEKAALAQLAFGKSGAALIPLFNDMEDGIQGAIEKAQKFGVLLSDDTARAAQTINDDFTIIREQVVAGAARFIEGLAPGLHAALGTVQEDLGANQDAWKEWGQKIGSFIGTTVLGAEGFIDRLVTSLQKLGNTAKAIGGFLTAGLDFASFAKAIDKADALTEANRQLEAGFAKRQAERLTRAEKIGEQVSKGSAGLPKLRGGTQEEQAPVVPAKSAEEVKKEIEALEAERDRILNKGLELEGHRHEAAVRNIEDEAKKLDQALGELEKKGVAQPNRAGLVASFRESALRAEEFRQQSEEATRTLNGLKAEQELIDAKIEHHVITQKEGAKQLAAIYKEQLGPLKEAAASLLATAQATGDPEAVAKAKEFASSLDILTAKAQTSKDVLQEAGKVAKQEFGASLKSALDSAISSGGKLITVLAQVGAAVASALASFFFTTALKAAGLGTGFAEGGLVSGPGTATSDSISARLSDGEFVVRAAAVSRPGMLEALHTINAGMEAPALGGLGRARRFADGGLVSGAGASPGGDSSTLLVGLEQGLVVRALKSPEGRRTVVRILGEERRGVGAALGKG